MVRVSIAGILCARKVIRVMVKFADGRFYFSFVSIVISNITYIISSVFIHWRKTYYSLVRDNANETLYVSIKEKVSILKTNNPNIDFAYNENQLFLNHTLCIECTIGCHCE